MSFVGASTVECWLEGTIQLYVLQQCDCTLCRVQFRVLADCATRCYSLLRTATLYYDEHVVTRNKFSYF